MNIGYVRVSTEEQNPARQQALLPLPDNFDDVVARWRRGEITAREAMRRTGIKYNTFYRRVVIHKK